jgi:hypothetical protein
MAWDRLDNLYMTWDGGRRGGAVHWHLPAGYEEDGGEKKREKKRTARFDVLPKILKSEEVDILLSHLPDVFDVDSDTVDDAPTYEFYLEKSGNFESSLASIPGKSDSNQEVLERRRPHREKIAQLVR